MLYLLKPVDTFFVENGKYYKSLFNQFKKHSLVAAFKECHPIINQQSELENSAADSTSVCAAS